MSPLSREPRGPDFWRALEAWAEGGAVPPGLQHELPRHAAAVPDRRRFLKLLGASMALAGFAGCSAPPPGRIVPRHDQSTDEDARQPQFYASVLPVAGEAAGVLVGCRRGRPTKLEGNPSHPLAQGATDALTQAMVLELWDPDRSQTPLRRGLPASWEDYAQAVAAHPRGDGEGLHVLGGRLRSPTLAAQRQAFLARYPRAQWHSYEPVDEAQALEGARLAFGRALATRYRLDRAQVVLAVDADLFGSMPGHLGHARAWMAHRRPDRGEPLPRLYAIEPTPSLTGSVADHRWAWDDQDLARAMESLAHALGIAGARDLLAGPAARRRLRALADDLRDAGERACVAVGPGQPARVHALAHLLNAALGGAGASVVYAEPAAPPGDIRPLLTALRAGQVETLLVLDANPAYALPAEEDFARLLAKVPHSMHLGLYRDETAALCEWHLPMAHPLETWSDLRAADGTVGIAQPAIDPLYDGRSSHEVIALWLGDMAPDGRALLRAHWRQARPDGDEAAFARAWEGWLRAGVVTGAQEAAPSPPPANGDFLREPPAPPAEDLALLLRPDPAVWDGRYANNAWLQELPRPLSQLSWGNAALIAPALAAKYGLRDGDEVELRCGARRLAAPVLIMPGQAPRSVTLHLGYGRRRAGRVGDGVGVDGYALRTLDSPWRQAGLQLHATGRRLPLAVTQPQADMQGREPARELDLAAWRRLAAAPPPPPAEAPSLYPPRAPGRHRWAMAIDLDSCIGCKACTIACQAENNIPVVGAEQVALGRQLHWLRVDRYAEGEPAAPRFHHQPVPCMHCEQAPCEVVCPVGATMHDEDGLNVQVYNRCVGTRFCSNNCPYKVRRFNFLPYAQLSGAGLEAQRNPEVSVRGRGVMEKCTYCIQRIETARAEAERSGRPLADGDVVTACQAACPTRAISFGDLNDAHSEVSRAKAGARDYRLLDELGTRPRTSYAARVRNPHPALADEAS